MACRPTAAYLLAFLLLGATASPLSAEQTRPDTKAPPSLRELEAALSRYYEKRFDIPQLLVQWEQLGAPARDGMMGFLTGVFVKHPEEINRATAATNLGRLAQAAVIQGLRLADRYPEALGAAAGWGWPQNQIATITPLRPLRQVKSENPRSFDMMWAASFATADDAYVRPIYDYYDGVASTAGVDVRDIVSIVLLRNRRDKDAMEAMETIKSKYSQEVFTRVIFASSALWSLESNARQHKFVAAALDRYVKEKPGSATNEGLAEMRKAAAARGAR